MNVMAKRPFLKKAEKAPLPSDRFRDLFTFYDGFVKGQLIVGKFFLTVCSQDRSLLFPGFIQSFPIFSKVQFSSFFQSNVFHFTTEL